MASTRRRRLQRLFLRQWRVSQSRRRWSVPKRTRRPEVERQESILWQRKQTQLCHTNQRSSTGSATRRSQSRLEMGFVGLEQNGLHHGLSAGQRRHRSDPSRKKEAEITQRSLEKTSSSTACQTLGEPQKVKKSRRTREKKEEKKKRKKKPA